MTQIGMNYWDNILDIIYKANEHIDQFDRFRAETLNEIQKTIRTHSSSFFLFDDELRPTNPVAINLAERHLKSYQAHYHRLNPFDPIYVNVPSRWVLLDTDVSDYSELKTSPIFTEFLEPQQTVRQMMLYLKYDQKLLGFIGLHRSDERDSFSEIELSIAERIAPFLSQALEKARLFKETKTKSNLIRAFLNQMPMGLAILDMDFNTLFQNIKARRIYSYFNKNRIRFHDFNAEQKPLPAIVYQKCFALKNHASLNHLKSGPLSVTFPIIMTKKIKYDVRIEVLRENDYNATDPVFFISIDEKKLNNQIINEEELKSQFGLTAREIEIITYLFKGFRNSEIADLLKIRCGTVKNHLKNVFSKMGVSTRTSLIYEALSISNRN